LSLLRKLLRRGYDRRAVASSRTAVKRPGVLALARVPSGVLVISAIVSIQGGAALAVTLFDRLGPGGAAFLRLLTATIVLLAVWRPRLRDYSRRQLALACAFGLVLGGMNLSLYESVDRIPLGIAVTIEFIGPLAVALGGSRRPIDFGWAALAALGIVALTRGDTHGLNAVGVALAALAGCLWAAYILLNARLGKAFETGTGLALAMCVSTLLVLPFGISDAGANLFRPHLLLLGAAVGMLSSAIPYSFEVEALRRIEPAVFGVLMSLEPAVAALAGLIVLGQSLGGRAIVGIALVVVASIGASRRTREAPVPG
jgi:inner membrane transporter RhtA